jgi:2-phosphoglycerate kinase
MDGPPVILVGGTAGCGKTTLAGQLTAAFDLDHRIGTGFIRAVLQSQADEVAEPALFLRTYESDDPVAGVRRQAARLQPAVLACIRRARDEGTSLVIEGTHLLPDLYHDQDVAFLVLEQPGEEEHTRRLSGRRHTRRRIEATDVTRIRRIGAFYDTEARRLGVATAHFGDNFAGICTLLGLGRATPGDR